MTNRSSAPCALSLLLLALVAGACSGGQGTTAYQCDPACAAGAHCTANGCVSDGEELDLAVPGGDLAPTCAPACSGATPICRNGHCVACLMDADCPVGQVCKTSGMSATCVPGCIDDSRCGGGAMKCCNSSCVDTSKDPGNCGDCGAACMVNHAGATCAGGKCMLGSCARGWADCNANPADGCEVNLRDDAGNCTACGMTCSLPHAVVGCAGGCYVRACNFGWDDCNAMEKDGCETNVAGDVRNCGGCGVSCPGVPRAKVACVNAACQLQSCDAGYADCDGNVANGCEVAINTDAANCGGCGMKCAQGLICVQGGCTCPNCNLPNAKSACVNFQCVVGSCNVGYGDCDGQPQNGCERAMLSDVNNCGGCGVKCDQGLVCTNGGCTCPQCNFANANSKCINNVCVLDSCLPGYGNCDGNAQNGCEADFNSDKNNCGKCGTACGQMTCQQGMCVAAVTIDTRNFKGYTEYPLDPDICRCCNFGVTAKQTADAFCKLAGYTVSQSYVSAMVNGNNCYCWNCTQANTWTSNCCGGQAVRPLITSVTCM